MFIVVTDRLSICPGQPTLVVNSHLLRDPTATSAQLMLYIVGLYVPHKCACGLEWHDDSHTVHTIQDKRSPAYLGIKLQASIQTD